MHRKPLGGNCLFLVVNSKQAVPEHSGDGHFAEHETAYCKGHFSARNATTLTTGPRRNAYLLTPGQAKQVQEQPRLVRIAGAIYTPHYEFLHFVSFRTFILGSRTWDPTRASV